MEVAKVEKRNRVAVVVLGLLALVSTAWSVVWTYSALSMTFAYISFEGTSGYAHVYLYGLTYYVTGGSRDYYGPTEIPLLVPFMVTFVLISILIAVSLRNRPRK